MLVRKPEQAEPQVMSLPGAQGVRMRIMVGRADGAPSFAMRLFEVEPSGHTPFHNHNYEHEVMILDGKGQVTGGVAGSTIRPLEPGDVVFLPANEKHQFRNVGAGPLRFVCLVPTQFDCGVSCQPTPGT